MQLMMINNVMNVVDDTICLIMKKYVLRKMEKNANY